MKKMTKENNVIFDKYILPVLSDLIYTKDGNEKLGELLFIDDISGRFTISFETGMNCLDLQLKSNPSEKIHSMELSENNKKMHLCYPLQYKTNSSRMGYFHFELTDKNGGLHILPGQISMGPPQNNKDDVDTLAVLNSLLCGFNLK